MRISDWSSDVCSSDLAEALARAAGRLEGLAEADLAALDEFRVQHVEDGVGLQHRQHAPGGVDRQGMALAQAEQAGHVVDVAVGQHHGMDRAVPHALARMKLAALRSEERRVGKEGVRTWRSRGWP